MKAENIRVDDVLELKRERQEAFALDSPFVEVAAIRTRGHYKTPWIYTRKGEAFRPADFKRLLIRASDYPARLS